MISRGCSPRQVTGGILAILLGSACGLGRGGTGQVQDDGDAAPSQGRSPSGSPSCTPFATQSCTCPGGGSGTATCPAGGQGFGACESCGGSLDASAHHDAAGGGGSNSDAAGDGSNNDAAAAGACNTCLATSCPGAQAACGTGTDCDALLACELACSNSSGSECSDTCTQMHPSGASAFTTLTICSLACGAGCLAGSTGGSDDAGSADDASND